jgi:Aconitase A
MMEVGGVRVRYYSLRALERAGFDIVRFPYTVKVFIENMLRNFDGQAINRGGYREPAALETQGTQVPRRCLSRVARVLMQDYTGCACTPGILAVMRGDRK